jgi:hypothetical protein
MWAGGLRWGIGATLVALISLVVYVLAQAYPSTEAVRLRNALLLQERASEVPDWTPSDVPPDFLLEQLPMPPPIAAAARVVASTVNAGDDLALARGLAAHLNSHAIRGGRIESLDVGEIYRKIIDEGNGYCADIIDAYVALALAAGLFVRPWAFSFDGYGGHGHINVEVFDRAHNAWVMLDVFNNVLPTERQTGRPLSVREFRSAFGSDPNRVAFEPIAAGPQRVPVYSKLVDYYVRGYDQWYLWNGNNVVSRTGSPVIRFAGRIGEPLAELVSIWQGRYPRTIPIASATNRHMLESMRKLRVKLVVSLYTAVGLVLLLVLEVGLLFSGTRSARL